MPAPAARKTKSRLKPADPGSQPAAKSPKAAFRFFPFARYVSVVGVHSALLTFVALFMARVPNSVLTLTSSTSPPFLEALTNDPKFTLVWMVVGVIPLQGWWAGWVRQWSNEYLIDGTDMEKKLERNEQDKGKFAKVKNAWLTCIAASFIIHVIIILFGAPILSQSLHTYLLACILSLLTVFTPAYAIGVPTFATDSPSLVTRLTWTRLFAELSPKTPAERAMVYSGVGAALGSWTGAFPIALDWDRPWQAWPLTPTFGAISGYITGSLAAVAVNAFCYLAEEGLRFQEQEQADSEKKTR